MAEGGSTAVAWVAMAAGAAGIFLALRAGGADTGAPTEDESDLTDAASLEGRLGDSEARLESVEKRLAEFDTRIAKAEQKAAAAESEAARALQEARAVAAGSGGAPSTIGPGDAPPASDAQRKADADALLAKIRAGEIHDGEGAFALMAKAKELGVLDEALKAMEAFVAANPSDPDALVELSSAYIYKLMQVPDGMERGKWSMMSIDACEKALKLEPEHWGAQFMKGMNLSQWPDFLGKQPEAIRTFETLIEQQERTTAKEGDDFAETYFQLGSTYRKAGKVDKALEAFKRGLAAHPDNKKLREQVEMMEKR